MIRDEQSITEAPREPALRDREAQREQAERLMVPWKAPTGWRLFSAVNNSTVGNWYMMAAFVFLLFGGVLALLMRLQLAVPNNTLLSADTYNQIFTLHGTVMMFLFAIPIFEAVSVRLLPQMLAARELPFPRLTAYGFWAYVIGGTFVCGSILFDAAPRGGWFMYPPLTSEYQTGLGADIWLLGLGFIEIAAIAAAVELIVGVLKCRPPGMRINLIPLYCWYVLVAGGMILFAFPPLIAGDLMLELERAFGWPFFDASRGGDPLLWQHLFWLFGHPEVYIIFLPSVALVAMILPTFARRPMVGYSWIVLAAVGTGFLSFGLWVHHMFTTGLPGISLALFSAASQAVAIPTGVQIFCFLATLLVGRVTRSLPMLFIFGALSTFVIGGLTGVMVAVASFDLQAHDTYFVVAHLHSVLIGGALFPLLAATYYYYPILTAKHLSERLGHVVFWLVFIGFNVAFLPMHITGLRGMTRRVYTYPAGVGFDTLNLVSTIGAVILVSGFALFAFDVFRRKTSHPLSPRNPWGAGTLEWTQEMPGKPWGVRSIPAVDSRYPLWDHPELMREIDEGRHFLPDAEEGKREMLVTSVIDARPEQCARVPGPSFLPMLAAIATAAAFIFSIFKLWWPAAAGLAGAMFFILRWLWTGTSAIPEKPEKYVGCGLTLPLFVSGPSSVSWWALFITMLADITAFVSLIFGYFFYWTVRPDFFLAARNGPGVVWPVLSLVLLLGAWALTIYARRRNRADRPRPFFLALVVAAVLAISGAAALIAGPWVTGLDPKQDAYSATVWIIVLWTALHALLGVVFHLYSIARRATGTMTSHYDTDINNAKLYWHFVAITAVVTVVTISGFPLLP